MVIDVNKNLILRSLLNDCRRKFSFAKMKNLYPLSHYELLQILYFFYTHPMIGVNLGYLKDEIEKNIIVATVSQNKCGIVSDTHVGFKSCDLTMIQEAYANMFQKGVRTVLHGGDFLNGFFNVNASKNKYYRQLNHFLKKFPSFPDLKHLFLVGNHDLVFQDIGIPLSTLISEKRPDMEVIGIERAYLKFQKFIIEINHLIKQTHIAIPIHQADIFIKGHTHTFNYDLNRNLVYLDSLSRNRKRSGYSIIEENQEGVLWSHYKTNSNDIKDQFQIKLSRGKDNEN